MKQTLEQAAEYYAEDHCDSYVLEEIQEKTFKAGVEWQKKQVSEYLDKRMEHAIRGSEKGNHIYHLGKIDLILAIQEWLKEEDEK